LQMRPSCAMRALRDLCHTFRAAMRFSRALLVPLLATDQGVGCRALLPSRKEWGSDVLERPVSKIVAVLEPIAPAAQQG
jgi:hypothetical protein